MGVERKAIMAAMSTTLAGLLYMSGAVLSCRAAELQTAICDQSETHDNRMMSGRDGMPPISRISPGSFIVEEDADSEKVVPGGCLRIRQTDGATILDIIRGSGPTSITLPPEQTIEPGYLRGAWILGASPGHKLGLHVSYESRPGSANHKCDGETESALYVIALEPEAHVTFNVAVTSCWNNIKYNMIGWIGSQKELSISFDIAGPVARYKYTRYSVGDDGEVTLIETQYSPPKEQP